MRPPVCEKEIEYFLGGGGFDFCFLCVIFEIFYFFVIVFFSVNSYFYFIILLSLLCVSVRIGGRKNLFLFFTVIFCVLNNIL